MSDVDGSNQPAVTFDSCRHLSGLFFHGTHALLHVGEELVPGRVSNFDSGRVMKHIYFAALLDTAVWGAELASALTGQDEPGHVYEVTPTGPFEDDPNVTNKQSAGNATQSYRSRHPLRVTRQVGDWQPHDGEVLEGMLHTLRLLREQGRDLIED